MRARPSSCPVVLLLLIAAAGAAGDAVDVVRFDFGSGGRSAVLRNAVAEAVHPGPKVEGAVDDAGRRTAVTLVQLDGFAGADSECFFLERGVDERARLRLNGLNPGQRYRIDGKDRLADRAGAIVVDFALADGTRFRRVGGLEVRGRFDAAPPDAASGPPVSAWAWVVADAGTGEILWSRNADVPLPMASTTKLMTARLVLRRAAERPARLDELVTVSRRADDTGGTTAGVGAGQRFSVRDLLYALLLPSGNDAAVALAEHFGPRDRFVAEMNREAARLSLRETRYTSAHGLDGRGHHQSARDLARMAWHFLEQPGAARLVGTRVHQGRALLPDGATAPAAWRNTNELLSTAEFDGVKTGWTRAAGGCLVARGGRNDDRLLVVVMRASGPRTRFTDARRLFQWAWDRRAAERTQE